MKKTQIKLQTKITLLVIAIVVISIFTTMFFTNIWSTRNLQYEVENNMMNIAQIVSRSPNVIEAFKLKDPNYIQPHIEDILNSTNEIDMIVIADMEGIRYAHPNPERVGQRFVGGDDLQVLEDGSSYISEAVGTLGKSVRAFVPIYDEAGEQLGFIMAGTLTKSISTTKKQRKDIIFLSSTIGMLLGGIGAITLARNIKESLLGIEPEQIAQMYIEKKVMLDTIYEGIMAIDENSKITLINDSALELLDIKKRDHKFFIGKDVTEFFPTSRLPEVVASGIGEYDREQIINDTIIITNRVPIINDGKKIGAIATFKDKTRVIKLAEELTGVKQVVEALRANTHEFMNKLHVVLGLIELGDLDEAKNYIINVNNTQQQAVNYVINKIKDPTIAGLMLGKFSRAKELGVNLILEEDSLLEKRVDNISSNTLLTIIGNLLENAMDAVTEKSDNEKQVNISIKESLKDIKIKVIDTGVGINEEDLPYIFNRGFSTKDGSRGIGLVILTEALNSLQGTINIDSQPNKGTTIIVTIPKEEEND